MSQVRRLATCLSLPVQLRFTVDNMTLGEVFLQALLFSLVSIIPQMLYVRLNLLTRRANCRSLETFEKKQSLSEIGQHSTGQ